MQNKLVKDTTPVLVLVYAIKGTSPVQYALYDVDSPEAARKRIEAKHPEYEFRGYETMYGKEETKELTRAFNKAATTYMTIAVKYSQPN